MAIAQRLFVRRRPLMLILFAAALQAAPASADRLVGPREVARGGYLAPRFAPGGDELLVSGERMSGLYLVALDSGAARRLTGDDGAGVHARWSGSSAVRYSAVRGGVRRELLVDRAGKVSLAPAAATRVGFTRDDRMYVFDRAGAVKRIGSGDRFFGAVASPDGDKIAFQGLTTGIYVHVRSTGALRHIGPGTAPAWSADGARLVFEVTEDDGHDVVASDLYLYEVKSDRVWRLTASDATVERRPSFSPDGLRVAFDDDRGAIFVGTLSTEEVR